MSDSRRSLKGTGEGGQGNAFPAVAGNVTKAAGSRVSARHVHGDSLSCVLAKKRRFAENMIFAGMLIASLFVLTAVTVNGLPGSDHGRRRTKQLDLQDIQAPVKEEPALAPASLDKNPAIINGYLPPAAPSSTQPSIVGAQSLQTFEFKPLNSLENENEPCKPTSDHVSCNSKNSSSSESKIPKPSRDLVPPFNDLEQETALPIGSKSRQEEEIKEIKVTARTRSKFLTTTEKLVSASSEHVGTRVTSKNLNPGSSATTADVTPLSSKAEATNELRSYLPPQSEFSAAAQTNVAVVQPSTSNNDHDHHHGHHHGENFDICADAFHSFLCAPLKARKRITGAFPSSLRGQSSFINYQKLLPNFEREPAPSNALQNAYLPPQRASSSTNLVQSTRPSPPLTTRPPVTPTVPTRPPPNIIPGPSNSNDRFYLPPLNDNKIVPAPSRSEAAFKFPPPKSTSTPRPSPITSTPRPAAITSPQTTVSTAFTNPPFTRTTVLTNPPPVFNFLPSNENRFYLPPNVNPQPAPSFITTSTNIHPVTPKISPQPSVSVSLPAIATSNSISTTRKPQPTFSIFTAATKPSTTAGKPQPSTSSTFATPSSSFKGPTSSPAFFNSVSYVSQTQKPLPPTKKPYISLKFAGQSSSEDRSYLPPETNLAAAAQTNSAALAPKNPFHHGRDLCTDPFHSFLCVSAKPRKRITGQLPSGFKGDSSNTQESRLKPEPADQKDNRVPLEGAPAQSLGYKYPKPNQPPALPNVIPTTTSPGYSYPKSDKVFPLQSQQSIKFTPATSSTTGKPELRPSEARTVVGYQYPKPDNPFPLPGEQSKVSPTTSSPTTGYSYPKPLKPLSLPTEQKEVLQKPKQRLPPPKADLASPTTQARGYQYPKPEQGLKLPEKSTGYSYPKPTKRLELPTESRLNLQANPSLDPLGALGSADFIPVNKLDFKRSESKLVAGLRRFGERQKKRQREAYAARKHGE